MVSNGPSPISSPGILRNTKMVGHGLISHLVVMAGVIGMDFWPKYRGGIPVTLGIGRPHFGMEGDVILRVWVGVVHVGVHGIESLGSLIIAFGSVAIAGLTSVKLVTDEDFMVFGCWKAT